LSLIYSDIKHLKNPYIGGIIQEISSTLQDLFDGFI